MPIYNVANDVINAYLAGLQAKLSKQEQEFRKRQLELAERRAQQEELFKAADLQLKAHEINRKAEEDERQRQQAIAKAKAEYGKLFATGQLQFPKRQLTPAEIASIVTLNAPAPDTREPFSIPGFNEPIYPHEIPDPYERARKMTESTVMQPTQARIAAQEELQKRQHEFEFQKLEKQFEYQQKLLQMRFANSVNKSSEVKSRFEQSMDQRQREKLSSTIASQLKARVITDYFGAKRAMYYLQTNAPDTQFMDFFKSFKFKDYNNGVRDLSLIYNYIRSLDESVVREGEINNLNRTAPLIARLGMGIERYLQAGVAPILSPEQRQKIADEIRKNYKAKLMAAKDHLVASYNIAKLVKPDLTFEQYKATVLPIVGEASAFNQATLDDISIDQSNYSVPSRTRREVILVPKKGN